MPNIAEIANKRFVFHFGTLFPAGLINSWRISPPHLSKFLHFWFYVSPQFVAACWTLVICTPAIHGQLEIILLMMFEHETSIQFPCSCGWFWCRGSPPIGYMPTSGLDYYVILCPSIIRVAPTIRLQKQFPCKCILVTVPYFHARLMQRHYWVVLVEDIDFAVWARPRHVDRPVWIFVDDKEYARVMITPKISWNYLHTFRPKQSGKGNFAAKKGVEEQSKGGQDRSIEDVQESRRFDSSECWWLVDDRCSEKLPYRMWVGLHSWGVEKLPIDIKELSPLEPVLILAFITSYKTTSSSLVLK